MTKPKPKHLPLSTERLELRAFRPEDLDDVHTYASDTIVTRYTDWGPNTLEETRAFLGEAIEDLQKAPPPSVALAVEHRESRRVIGTAGLQLADSDLGDASFGFCINRDFWGRGFATEAAQALLVWASDAFELHRIYATCRPDNHASARVLEKLGLRREGRLRKNILVDGGWRDSLLYALVLEDDTSRKRQLTSTYTTPCIDLAKGADHVGECERILRGLPAWFGIEDAIVEYVEQIGELTTFVAREAHEAVGFLSIEHHSEATAEIIVMGVAKTHHRRGVGRALVDRAEEHLRKQGIEFLQVKTLSSAHDSAEYALTRQFYRAVGFQPVQEFSDLWDEANPCLQMIKWIR